MLFLAENLKIHESASIAFDRSNVKRAKPKPIYKQKEQTHQDKKSCMFALCLVVLV